MKYLLNYAFLILFFYLIIISCKKDNVSILEDILLSNEWTQKVGIEDNKYYGRSKMYYRLSFQDNGFCNIVYDLGTNFGEPIELDSVQIKYEFENGTLMFPEPFLEFSYIQPFEADTIISDAFFCDWLLKGIKGDVINLVRQENPNKKAFVFGSKEIYIEPIK